MLRCHNHDYTHQRNDGGEGLRFQHAQEDVVALDSRKTENPRSQCGSNVGAHQNANGLAQLHDAGVDQPYKHDRQCRGGLNGNGDAHPE